MNNNAEQEDIIEFGSKIYKYSVKIDQTALGARISVHAYDDNMDKVMKHALYIYAHMRRELVAGGWKVAPEEPTRKSNSNKKTNNDNNNKEEQEQQ